MNPMRTFPLIGVLVFVSGCTRATPPPAVVTPQPAAVGSAPVALRWIVVESTSSSATLRLEIDKNSPLEADLKVSFVVPPGVSIEPSAIGWSIPAATTGASAREYKLKWVSQPQTDFVVEGDSQGTASGVHAIARYAFGRPDGSADLPRGEPAQVGATPLGRPVDLNK